MTTTLFPYPVFRAFDANAVPLAGGLLYSYAAGTTTPLATYTDESGDTPNANPVVLDSTGSANVWLANAAYKLVLKDASGTTQWTVDNIEPSLTVNFGVNVQTSGSDITLSNPLATAQVLTLSASGKNVYLPVANANNSIPLGVPILIFNKSNAFTLKAQDTTTTVGTVPPGGAILTLSDNSTDNGTWQLEPIPAAGLYMTTDVNGALTLNLGSNMGGDTNSKLVWKIVPVTPGTTSLTLTETHRGAYISSASAGGALTCTLPDATAVGDGYPVWFERITYDLIIAGYGGTQLIALPGYPAGTVSYTLDSDTKFVGLLSSDGAWVPISGRPDIAPPGAAGNILTSNGTNWTSASPPASLITSYVNFAGATGAINGTSLNVGSVTRSGSGNYTVNFSSNYADINYLVFVGVNYATSDATHGSFWSYRSKGVGSVTLEVVFNGYGSDPSDVSVMILGT